jgi:pyruvate/2-oxoglutarate dehydrogenase complex dihydrolipoamide acyltransferase (E2) component
VPVHGLAEVRRRMRLTMSCDHRAVDGARAAAFLTDLGDLIEEPAALL